MPYATGTRMAAYSLFLLCLLPPWIQAFLFIPAGLWLIGKAQQKEDEKRRELEAMHY